MWIDRAGQDELAGRVDDALAHQIEADSRDAVAGDAQISGDRAARRDQCTAADDGVEDHGITQRAGMTDEGRRTSELR